MKVDPLELAEPGGDQVPAVLREGNDAGIRDPLHDPCRVVQPVADEEAERRLAGRAAAARNEVGRVGLEGDEAPVTGHRERSEAVAVGLDAAGAEVNSRSRARTQVPYKDVTHAVGVARHEVGGRRRERDERAVPGHRDVAWFGRGVTDHPSARDVDADRVRGRS